MFGETNYINWVELLWLLMGVGGLVISNVGLYSAIKDLGALEKVGINGQMEKIAKGVIRTEVVRSIMNVCVIFVGVYSFTVKPSPLPFTIFQWIIVSVFFAIPLCTICNSTSDFLLRRDIMGNAPSD